MTTESPRRRWYQFRLRTLLIAVLVLSLPLSWIAARLVRVKKQREAVAIIEKAGGRVGYRSALASIVFGNDVVTVDVTRQKFGDEEAACLENLTGLVVLYLDHCQVTDKGLEHLEGLVNLKGLSLREAPITDTGLQYLRGMGELQVLSLDMTQITDAGLEHLKGLDKLEGLTLHDTEVTPEGVEQLQEALPNCHIIQEPLPDCLISY